MSIIHCFNCNSDIDTDYDMEHFDLCECGYCMKIKCICDEVNDMVDTEALENYENHLD